MSDPGSRPPRPTLRSLAAATGLAVSTVSQALRNGPQIAEKTRWRVQQAALELGYYPNRAGVRLKTGKTHVICLLLSSHEHSAGHFEEMIYSLATALAVDGYHLVITPCEADYGLQPVRYIAETRAADGVIVTRVATNDPRVRLLADHHVPFVTHGRTDMGLDHPYVDFDNEDFALAATGILAQKKRRTVALLGLPAHMSGAGHMQAGFARGLEQHSLTQFPLEPVAAGSSHTDVKVRMREIARQPNRPDGFVFAEESSAFATIHGYEEEGLILGRDFDAVAKHSTPLLPWCKPDLDMLFENYRTIGSVLGRFILGAIRGDETRSLQVVLPV